MADVVQRAVAEAVGVLVQPLVHRAVDVDAEVLLDEPRHLLDGVLEEGDDAQAHQVRQVIQALVDFIRAGQLAGEALGRLDAVADAVDAHAAALEHLLEVDVERLAQGLEGGLTGEEGVQQFLLQHARPFLPRPRLTGNREAGLRRARLHRVVTCLPA